MGKVNLTAIMVESGLITLIEPTGNIGSYLQRGVLSRCTETEREAYVKKGLLVKNWGEYQEIPKGWGIYFEDSRISGKATITFPPLLEKAKKSKKATTKTKKK